MKLSDSWSFLLGLAVTGSCPGTGTNKSETKPNIIFILASDLDYGELGFYGQIIIEIPNIFRLAETGCGFPNIIQVHRYLCLPDMLC